jgi:hypothetical protein
MTIKELYSLCVLLTKYVAQEPMSHKKRDVIHEIILQAMLSLKLVFSPSAHENDIPF